MKVRVIPAPEYLKHDVECIRVTEHQTAEGLAINVLPKALPGIVFQHQNGESAIENITTPSHVARTPTLFLYGAVIEPSVMHYKAGSYTTIQVIFKPYALKSLFGLNATALAKGSVEVNEFWADDLNGQLMDAKSVSEQVGLLSGFLARQVRREYMRDALVEAALRLIHQCPADVSVNGLLQFLNLSERQFQRRFLQAVGVTPQAYIRVVRFNEAVRLIKTGQYGKLTDIAHALHYYDQSHFIRDIKALSGLTPKAISTKQSDSFHHLLGYSYV